MSGRWEDPEFPKTGWTCTDVEDLGEGEENHDVCEMCETTKIRYVHTMEHPGLLDVPLHCGCICAGHMEGNLGAAKERETTFKKRQHKAAKEQETIFKKRKQWMSGWRDSHQNSNNICRAVPGFCGKVTVFEKNGIYTAVFNGKFSGKYTEQHEAMDAAFDLVYPK
jgi:hypothetical protein